MAPVIPVRNSPKKQISTGNRTFVLNGSFHILLQHSGAISVKWEIISKKDRKPGEKFPFLKAGDNGNETDRALHGTHRRIKMRKRRGAEEISVNEIAAILYCTPRNAKLILAKLEDLQWIDWKRGGEEETNQKSAF
ncbi:SgrR family transcriptional regulator [Bacillus licheniformis]